MDVYEILLYVISIGITILGTYFGLKAIKKKKPVYTKTNFNMITKNVPSFPDLNITFQGSNIENLSSTNFVFWNSGNERIEKNDIAEKSQLRIEAIGGIKIFSALITYRTALENAFEIKINQAQDTVLCKFDYLSKNDGVIIQIIHSGRSSDDLVFTGTIKDIGSPIDVTGQIKKSCENYTTMFLFTGIGIGIILMMVIFNFIHIEGLWMLGVFFGSILLGAFIGRYLIEKRFLGSLFLCFSSPQYLSINKQR